MVVGEIGLLEDGRELKLVGRHFVVTGLDRDAKAVRFDFKVKHEGFHTRGNGAEIVVLELLVLGALVAH